MKGNWEKCHRVLFNLCPFFSSCIHIAMGLLSTEKRTLQSGMLHEAGWSYRCNYSISSSWQIINILLYHFSLARLVIHMDFNWKHLASGVAKSRQGLGKRPQSHCPICIVLFTWVGFLHWNQQDRMAIFRSKIISNGFPCSYNSVLAILVISIWKLVQVNNLM